MSSVAFWKACEGMTSCSKRWHQPHQSAKRSTKISRWPAFAFFCASATLLSHGPANAWPASRAAAMEDRRMRLTGLTNDLPGNAIPVARQPAVTFPSRLSSFVASICASAGIAHGLAEDDAVPVRRADGEFAQSPRLRFRRRQHLRPLLHDLGAKRIDAVDD